MNNEKLSLLTELIKLANSDNKIRDEEFQFLHAIAKQLGVSDEDFKPLFVKHIDFTPPKSELDRIVQFQRLVLMMNVDQQVSQTQIDHVRDIGIRMGLGPISTNKVLQLMKQYENGMIPPDVLLGIFRTQHN